MSYLYSGITKVEYTTDIEGAWTELGDVSPDESFVWGVTKTNTTTGIMFGGGFRSGSVRFLTPSTRIPLEALMESNTEVFVRVTFQDGTVVYSLNSAVPHVATIGEPDARTGLVPWMLDTERWGHMPQWFNAGTGSPLTDGNGNWLTDGNGNVLIS